MDQETYFRKVYGGLIGKCIGVRLGAPVEPTIWTYDRIRLTYGDIRGYIKDYRNFAADDDINGPLFFIRSLIDYPVPLSAESVGRSWLNYTREGIGFYWWGGYGRSTEHTAYLNLKSGMPAPLSGSIEVNGATVAEQIGGQIFIDSWGWISPGDCIRAADLAGTAASVGHDRNGIYGGRFIAACISAAFTESDIMSVLHKALETVPEGSEYRRVVTEVRDFYKSSPDDWRSARAFLEENFGYDRYPGVCHIIPNAGVCALALCYGAGDFARTVEIAVMCGWDTDCNAGNVGAILGVLSGMDRIPEHYIRPLHDFHAASSISGALNAVNLVKAAKELAMMGLDAGAVRSLLSTGKADEGEESEIPSSWFAGTFTDDIILDLRLPKSSGGLRTTSSYLAPVGAGEDFRAEGATVVLLDRLQRGDIAGIYYPAYYRREDFDDERYSPTFTPTVYPGQKLKITGRVERMSGQRIALAPYVLDAGAQEPIHGGYIFPAPNEEFTFEWEIPAVGFAVRQAGVLAANFDAEKFLGKLRIEHFSITGARSFTVSFCDERHEFKGLSRCSCTGGAWELEDGGLRVITNDTFRLYSGPYYTRNSTAACELVPEYGDSHLMCIRSAGAESGYFFGLHGSGKAALIRQEHESRILCEVPFDWKIGQRLRLEMESSGERLLCRINGKLLIDYTDIPALPYGMAGVAKLGRGRTLFLSLSAEERP